MELMKKSNIFLHLVWCVLLIIFVINVDSRPISCLDSIKGQVIYPNDKTFPSLIIDENIAVNYTPAVLVYPNDNADVQTAIKCAVNSKIGIIARSGGHSYENYGLGGRNNVVVVDVSNINQIVIDTKGQTAKIGAGNKLGVIYHKLSQAGFLIPAGSCPSVGIGGHSLGGGFGFSSRRYGYVVDSIVSMEMVDANGDLLQVDSKTNSDLLFALKGAGGGSYGIVTSFVIRIYPAPPQVTVMHIDYKVSQAQQFFDTFNKIGPLLSKDIVLSLSYDKGSLSVDGLYLGPSNNAKKEMSQFLSAPKPTSTVFHQKTFFESVVELAYESEEDTINPKHHPYFFKVKSFLVNQGNALTPQAITFMTNFLKNVSCTTSAEFDLFGGATTVADVSSSFIHRDVLYGIQLMGQDWKTKEQGDQCIKELNEFGKAFQEKFTSYFSYQNYIDRDLDDWETRYYGDNFKKLVEIKAKYDPNNLFNFPQSIPVSI